MIKRTTFASFAAYTTPFPNATCHVKWINYPIIIPKQYPTKIPIFNGYESCSITMCVAEITWNHHSSCFNIRLNCFNHMKSPFFGEQKFSKMITISWLYKPPWYHHRHSGGVGRLRRPPGHRSVGWSVAGSPLNWRHAPAQPRSCSWPGNGKKQIKRHLGRLW